MKEPLNLIGKIKTFPMLENQFQFKTVDIMIIKFHLKRNSYHQMVVCSVQLEEMLKDKFNIWKTSNQL